MYSSNDLRASAAPEDDAVGYRWLAHRFGLHTVAPLTVHSFTGRQASRTEDEQGRVVQVLRHGRTQMDSQRWHLGQALKHEGVHLELLARIFEKMDPSVVGEWIAQEPTSAQARRAGFLYEWLTGKHIHGHENAQGNYVDALDDQQYLVAQHTQMNRRWRVVDNMPGSPQFCPMVRRTSAVRLAMSLDIAGDIGRLVGEFGDDMLTRSANWLSIKESKASFTIEREGGRNERIRRFAAAMAQYCGVLEDPLEDKALIALQRSILADRSASPVHLGLRRSPVFVGRTIRYEPVVDYLAPHQDHVAGMLEGLRTFAQRTAGDNPIARAAILSFGFVYIHPLSDGNGRVSRFLINDTLRRDGAIPAPLILPVSSVIQEQMRHYDQVLESISGPMMRKVAGEVSFASQASTFEDGVQSNLQFAGWDELLPAWRFMDLTQHVRYLSDTLRRTVHKELRSEAAFLRSFDQARSAVRDVIDGRDEDIDRIVNAIKQARGVSGKLRKEFPQVFGRESVSEEGQAIEQAVLQAFEVGGSDREGVEPDVLRESRPRQRDQ